MKILTGTHFFMKSGRTVDWIAHEKNAIVYLLAVLKTQVQSQNCSFVHLSFVKKKHFMVATKSAIIEKKIETGFLILFLTARLGRKCEIAPKSKMEKHLNIDRD